MAEGALKPWEMDFGPSGGEKKPWEMSFDGTKPAPRAEPAPPPPLSDGSPKGVMDLATSAASPALNIGMGEAALNMGTGMVAKPTSEIMGMAAMLKSMFSGDKSGDPQGFQREVQDRMTYQPRTQIGKNVAQYNPIALIAKLFGAAGDKAEQVAAPPETSGPLRAAIGSGVGEGVKQLPSFLGIKAPPVASAAAGAVKNTARGTMQSALKPSIEALQSGKAGKAIDTMLEKGVNVSPGGAELLQDRISLLNNQIEKIIDSSPATIDKKHVGYYLQETIDNFKKQVNPAKDVRTIQRAWDEFLDSITGDKLSVRDAQDLKQGTYKSIKGKAYGELKGAEVEAQKTLARGLKEEIARAAPQVRALNAEESQLLNALSLVEKRALQEANKNPAGLGWLTTDPVKFAAWMGDRSAIFKSLVARMLNTGAEALPPLGAAGPAIGAAASQDRQQIPPPPR